jgi:type I restriction enzyme S subunit
MTCSDEKPRNWSVVNIGGISTVTKLAGFEFTNFIKYQDDGPVRVVRGLNVGFGKFRASNFKYIDIETSESLPRSQLSGGEILIAYVGTLGTAAIVPKDGYRYHLGPNVGKIVIKEQVSNPKFILYFLLSPFGQEIIHSKSKAVAQSSLSMQQIRLFQLPLAPLPEQDRIVSKIEELLTKLDAGVDELKKAKAQVKRYRQSILKAAVTGELTRQWREARHHELEPADQLLSNLIEERIQKWKGKYRKPQPPDTNALPPLPTGWVWATLDQISWDSGYGTSIKCDYNYDGYPVLRIPNISQSRVVLSDIKYAPKEASLKADFSVSSGDLLVIRTNGSRNLIGRGTLVLQEYEQPHFFASYLIRFRLSGSPTLWRWLNLYWESQRVRDWIFDKAATSAGQYNVSMTNLIGLPIAIPPLREQQEIESRLSNHFSIIDNLSQSIDYEYQRTSSLRQAILKKAFTGKLIPQDPNDEPAEKLLQRIGQSVNRSIQSKRRRKSNGDTPNGK